MARSLILAASPSESGTRTKLECRFPCRAGARVLGTLEIARRQWGTFPQTEACASGGAVLASAGATPQAQFSRTFTLKRPGTASGRGSRSQLPQITTPPASTSTVRWLFTANILLRSKVVAPETRADQQPQQAAQRWALCG